MKRSGIQRKTPLKRGGSLSRSGGLKRGKGINPVSVKTKARNRRYMDARRTYLEANPLCEYRTDPNCGGQATEIDHIVPRGLAPERVDDPTNFRATCRACHVYRHEKMGREERESWGLGIYNNQGGTKR